MYKKTIFKRLDRRSQVATLHPPYCPLHEIRVWHEFRVPDLFLPRAAGPTLSRRRGGLGD